jgi:hypothetical protein
MRDHGSKQKKKKEKAQKNIIQAWRPGKKEKATNKLVRAEPDNYSESICSRLRLDWNHNRTYVPGEIR